MKKRWKRPISLLLILSIAFGLLCGNAWASEIASGWCGDNLVWTLNSAGTLTISGTGAMYQYTDDDVAWYGNQKKIKKVVIKSGATTLGQAAFDGCSNLKSISIPGSVSELGDFVFYGCSSLQSVTIPNGVYYIDKGVFSGCSSLQSVTIPNSVHYLGMGVFYGCSSLKTIILPSSLTYIDNGAFSHCKRLSKIYFTGNAPTITSTAFEAVKAAAYYPVGNKTWTSAKRRSYGGKLTWKIWNSRTTTLTKVTAGRKKAVVKWKKTAKVTGYQVQYATGKAFKKAKTKLVKGAKKTSVTLKKLKGKKKYYFRVRTYKVDGKKKYYSAWSKARAVTVKK